MTNNLVEKLFEKHEAQWLADSQTPESVARHQASLALRDKNYSREKDLSRCLRPGGSWVLETKLLDEYLTDFGPAGTALAIYVLEISLRRHKSAAEKSHWSYNRVQHIANIDALRAEKARLLELYRAA